MNASHTVVPQSIVAELQSCHYATLFAAQDVWHGEITGIENRVDFASGGTRLGASGDSLNLHPRSTQLFET